MTAHPSKQRPGNDQALLLIEAAHAQLTAFAATCYAAEGRGLIHVAIQALTPGSVAVIDTTMVYLTLDHVRQLIAGLPARHCEGNDALIAAIESYDPHRQALVSVEIGRSRPVTIAMDLDQPVVPEEVGGIH